MTTITERLERNPGRVVVDAAKRAEWRRLYGHDNAIRHLLDYVDHLERLLGIGAGEVAYIGPEARR